MPTFSSAMAARHAPTPVGVVVADVRQHRDRAISHVRRVVPAEHADLDHRHVDRDSAKYRNAAAVRISKYDGVTPASGSTSAMRRDRLGEPRRR